VGAELFGEPAGQLVGAVVAAEQRHDAFGIGADGDHRGFLALVAQVRGQQANEDSGGTDADDRHALAEQPGEQRRCVLAIGAAVMDTTARRRGDAQRQIGSTGREADYGRYHAPRARLAQASSPR